MSQVRKDVDLAALARPAESIQPPRRSWVRLMLPIAIVGTFLFLLRDAWLELLDPPLEVTLVRPTPIEGAAVRTAPGQVAVQAAGWVEPDPFPDLVPALAGGVVAEMLVQESDTVAAGDPIARMVDDDALLAREMAVAELAQAEADILLAKVREGIAQERFEVALEVTRDAKATAARHEGREAESAHRAAAVREGEARVALAESEVIVQRELDAAGAAGPRQVEIAEAELEVAQATLASLEADAARARAERDEAAADETLAHLQRELRFEDRLERDISAAEVKRAEALLAHHRVLLSVAELRLERMVVRAPRDGVVLERLVTAGEAVAVGHPVVSLYAPDSLRIRVDVPQGDVERIFVGQRAEITIDSRSGRPYTGEVLRLVQRADIQKVTLEAQVRVQDSDEYVRPDMLAQVRFFGREEGASSEGPGGEMRLSIPRDFVAGDKVWVFDPVAGTARHRTVQVAPLPGASDRVEILGGLNPTDKLIERGREALDEDRTPVRVLLEGKR